MLSLLVSASLAIGSGLDGGRCVGGLVPAFVSGQRVGDVCATDAATAGLTVVDLSDGWAPSAFATEDGADRSSYRQRYAALADERPPRDAEGDAARADRYLELFGIVPTLRVLRGRILDESRHRCHEAIDDAPLAALAGILRPDPGSDPLVSKPPGPKVRARRAAVSAVQAHLACDGLLRARDASGRFDRRTLDALRVFQRKHAIISAGWVDGPTRTALLAGSRALDHAALLRFLRERVTDAAGLLEDGTAASLAVTDETTGTHGVRAASDLVSQATAAATAAIGWADVSSAHDFLAALPDGATASLRVALRLPPAPAYHSSEMALRAEIDRGDVWYDFPYTSDGRRRRQPIERRPTLTLYAHDRDGEIALVRWPTTIGGWKRERLADGRMAMKYKGSPAGSWLWRDLVMAPVWYAPGTTPADELVRRAPDGTWRLDDAAIGPGYRSAYGLAMLIHHRIETTGRLVDLGVRTHGTANYRSVGEGTSHGCHRLLPASALRLASFLRRHHRNVPAGPTSAPYTIEVLWQGQILKRAVASRGQAYAFDPPIPVEVLEGRVRGRLRQPIRAPLRLPGVGGEASPPAAQTSAPAALAAREAP